MMPDLFLRLAVEPALDLLPPQMGTTDAQALLLAIALQESHLTARRQFGGPARSYFQFEQGGVEGVLEHRATAHHAHEITLSLDVLPTAEDIYRAIEFHDVLACVFARLLIWTLPAPLPARANIAEGYGQYLAAWRPGRPRPETWDNNFVHAWGQVQPV